MRKIPVADIELVLVGIQPYLKNGEQVVGVDGTPVVNVSALRPASSDDKAGVLEVRVPANRVDKSLTPYSPIRFEDLTARPWAYERNSGVVWEASSCAARKAS